LHQGGGKGEGAPKGEAGPQAETLSLLPPQPAARKTGQAPQQERRRRAKLHLG